MVHPEEDGQGDLWFICLRLEHQEAFARPEFTGYGDGLLLSRSFWAVSSASAMDDEMDL